MRLGFLFMDSRRTKSSHTSEGGRKMTKEEVGCPLCYGERTRFFDHHPKVSQDVWFCEDCKFHFVYPHVPYVHSERDEIEADAAPGYWANKEAIDHYLAWRENENERLAQWALNAIRPGRVLEIGVGDGPLARRIAPRVADYWGIEPDANAIERARQLLPDAEKRLFQLRSDEMADANAFGDAAGSFDAMFLFSVLEHIPAPRDFFKLARRFLKPDGKLIISVPNSTHFRLFYRLRKLIGIEPWTYFHISFFSRAHLVDSLKAEGFEVTSIRTASLLTPDSIAYFEKRYRSRVLGLAMRGFAALKLDSLTGMNTFFLVCTPASAHTNNEL